MALFKREIDVNLVVNNEELNNVVEGVEHLMGQLQIAKVACEDATKALVAATKELKKETDRQKTLQRGRNW